MFLKWTKEKLGLQAHIVVCVQEKVRFLRNLCGIRYDRNKENLYTMDALVGVRQQLEQYLL